MKIAMMTTWNARCGVASYSETLIEGLRAAGHEVKIIANKPNYYSLPEFVDPTVTKCFEVTIHSKEVSFDFETAMHIVHWADLLHIQFETSMYHPDWMPSFIEVVSLTKPVVVTMHSIGMWPTFPVSSVSHFIGHDKETCANLEHTRRGVTHISMGIRTDIYENPVLRTQPPIAPSSLRSFGLGRNMEAICASAVVDTGLDFLGVFGDRSWVLDSDLTKFLLDASAIVLFYPPVETNVSSSAAAYALRFPRALFVSDTGWFNWLNDWKLSGIYRVRTEEDLKSALKEFKRQGMPVVHRYAQILEQGLDYRTAVISRHTKLYENLK